MEQSSTKPAFANGYGALSAEQRLLIDRLEDLLDTLPHCGSDGERALVQADVDRCSERLEVLDAELTSRTR